MTKATKMTSAQRQPAWLKKYPMWADEKSLGRIKRLHDKMQAKRKLKPMAKILDMIPWPEKNMTAAQKAKYLGVQRQSYYAWLAGKARPSARYKKAEKIARLTGLTVEEITGG